MTTREEVEKACRAQHMAPGYVGTADDACRIMRALLERAEMAEADRDAARKALTAAAATIGALYEFAETADATSISGIARCNAMLASMKKNRARMETLVMEPARAALARGGEVKP